LSYAKINSIYRGHVDWNKLTGFLYVYEARDAKSVSSRSHAGSITDVIVVGRFRLKSALYNGKHINGTPPCKGGIGELYKELLAKFKKNKQNHRNTYAGEWLWLYINTRETTLPTKPGETQVNCRPDTKISLVSLTPPNLKVLLSI